MSNQIKNKTELFETIDGSLYLPNGVEIKVNPAGVVLWSSCWVSLFACAYKNEYGLTTRKGGCGTMGHVDVAITL